MWAHLQQAGQQTFENFVLKDIVLFCFPNSLQENVSSRPARLPSTPAALCHCWNTQLLRDRVVRGVHPSRLHEGGAACAPLAPFSHCTLSSVPIPRFDAPNFRGGMVVDFHLLPPSCGDRAALIPGVCWLPCVCATALVLVLSLHLFRATTLLLASRPWPCAWHVQALGNRAGYKRSPEVRGPRCLC